MLPRIFHFCSLSLFGLFGDAGGLLSIPLSTRTSQKNYLIQSRVRIVSTWLYDGMYYGTPMVND